MSWGKREIGKVPEDWEAKLKQRLPPNLEYLDLSVLKAAHGHVLVFSVEADPHKPRNGWYHQTWSNNLIWSESE